MHIIITTKNSLTVSTIFDYTICLGDMQKPDSHMKAAFHNTTGTFFWYRFFRKLRNLFHTCYQQPMTKFLKTYLPWTYEERGGGWRGAVVRQFCQKYLLARQFLLKSRTIFLSIDIFLRPSQAPCTIFRHQNAGNCILEALSSKFPLGYTPRIPLTAHGFCVCRQTNARLSKFFYPVRVHVC